MITLTDAAPGAGLIIHGAAGLAGGAGPQPAGGPYDAVSDATVAFAGAGDVQHLAGAMAQPLPVTPMPALPQDGRLGDGLEMTVLFLSGILFMLVSSFFRRRHRRRLGWGVLPERSLFGRD